MQPLDPTSLAPFKFIGDSGMRIASNGSLIIKPALPAEREFYESLIQDPYLAPLRPLTPKFLGTLETSNQTCQESTIIPSGRTQRIILENLCKGFLKPNTLDVKLGTVFHDARAAPDKVQRAEKTARETTSRQTGIRLAEFQVHDNLTSEPICISKSYGKAMKSSELPDGIAQFFLVQDEPSRHRGRTCGLPRRTLLPILCGIREAISEMHRIYSGLEMRIIGGSLLIVYEADWDRAEEGVKAAIIAGRDIKGQPAYVVRLIDFAHARLAPGEGPDRGVLLGLETMLTLIDGRIARLANS